MRNSIKICLAATLPLTIFIGAVTLVKTPTDNASAVSAKSFQSGRIVDDSIFTNYRSMSVAQIKAFLNNRVNCDTNGSKSSEYGGGTRAQYGTSKGVPPPYTCLKDYVQNGKSAAKIIYEHANTYKINPKILIVLLQKEQGLVTDEWPWPIQYRSATGYGCPDNAPCDRDYYGFSNQVKWAATMFRKILNNDPNWFVRYTLGNNKIYWHPDQSRCGSSTVNIANRSTQALYNYTPYRPNSAALNAGFGEGDSCSSHGNRNFYLYFRQWFGNPTIEPGSPIKGDWDGDGKTNVGAKRKNVYYLYDSGGQLITFFSYGKPTDRTVIGDWNGDGKESIGLRRGDRYYLDYDNNGSQNVSFQYGRSSDGAIIGDWNGDGKDTIGLRRDNKYYLNNNHDSHHDIAYKYGKSSDGVIIGDWNGDGKDTLGLRRGSVYYLNYNHDSHHNVGFEYGRSSDKVLAGDWDGDNIDEIGLRRDNKYYLNYGHDSHHNVAFKYGKDSDKSLVGNWGGNARVNIGLERNDQFFLDYDNNGSQNFDFFAIN